MNEFIQQFIRYIFDWNDHFICLTIFFKICFSTIFHFDSDQFAFMKPAYIGYIYYS